MLPSLNAKLPLKMILTTYEPGMVLVLRSDEG